MGTWVIKYSELLTLSIEQLFYQNKICPKYKTEPVLDFTIAPTEECRSLMQKLNFVFKNTDRKGGFIVLARTLRENAAGNNLLRFNPKKENKLSFFVFLKNPAMLNFNDLPTDISADKIYYFSNQVSDPAALRNNLHLTANSSGVNGADDTIKKSSENYSFHSAVPVALNTAKVKHVLTGAEVIPKSLINQGGQADLTFDLSVMPLGKCQLLINNIETDKFYYLKKISNQAVFAVIELSLSGMIDANYRIVEPDNSLTSARPAYTVRFNNRQTLWRYSVNLENSSPLYLEMMDLSPADQTAFMNRLNIENTDGSIVFTRTIVNNKKFVFESNNPQALQEKYISSDGLTLYKNIGVDKKPVKSNLQYPEPDRIDASGNPVIRSEIFMTL